MTQKYVHGFSSEEQARLDFQARFLEEMVYSGINLSEVKYLLEVGSGTGAQMKMLLEKYPDIHITGVELSVDQIRQASETLNSAGCSGRYTLLQADATDLSGINETFDAAFLCWFLEHVSEPLRVLREIKKKLTSGSVIYITEVYNRSFSLFPESEIVSNYWCAFNELQMSLGGDPDVGMKVAHYLKKTGFRDIEVKLIAQHHDGRDERARAEMLTFFSQLLLSAADQLVERKMIPAELVADFEDEIERYKTRDCIFFYSGFQTRARAH